MGEGELRLDYFRAFVLQIKINKKLK